jgi:hypothetical protein
VAAPLVPAQSSGRSGETSLVQVRQESVYRRRLRKSWLTNRIANTDHNTGDIPACQNLLARVGHHSIMPGIVTGRASYQTAARPNRYCHYQPAG